MGEPISADHQCPLRSIGKCYCASLARWPFGSLSDSARQIRLSRRERLGEASNEADGTLAVTRGVAALSQMLPDGRRSILALLFPGELIDLRQGDRPQEAGIEALTKAEVCVLDGSTFDRIIDADRGLRAIASQEMRKRTHQTLNHILDLSKRRPIERFASFLFETMDRDVDNGGAEDVVRLPISRGDIGDYLGLQPETVSRTIRALETQQCITLVRRNEIRIRDVNGLRQIARGGGLPERLPRSDHAPMEIGGRLQGPSG